ncbi:unnamed protein product, partial [Iphiclides podalirius]
MRLLHLLLTCLLSLSVESAFADHYHPERESVPSSRRATADGAELTAKYWYDEAEAGIRARRARLRQGKDAVARNVVMFLGDGMSVPTLAAARILLGQRNNRPGEEEHLSFESFPTVGLTKTYCVNSQIADSACTATAYLCGVKNNNGMLGLTAAVPRRNCTASLDTATNVESIAAWALQDGRDAGIVTTTRVTHASPAGVYAKAANRNWENDARVREDNQDPNNCPDIAYQLVHSSPGKHFKAEEEENSYQQIWLMRKEPQVGELMDAI